MRTRICIPLVALLVVSGMLAGGGGEPETVVITAPPDEIFIQQTVAAPAESQVAYSASELEWSSQPAPTPGADREPAEPDPSGPAMASLSYRPNRLIVKDAQLRLMVADTDLAIDRVTQVVDDCGAYIISSRVWYQDWMEESYKYASMTIGVPVDQFERAIRRLRDLAVQVVDETAAGQDVTDEYVDLQSRLGNLEATRDHIREFLDRAQDVEEALRVNEELSAVEAQIEQVQGRMNYLFDRAAFSTITVQIDPELPQPTPTPTPTPAPPWSPGPTIRQAGQTLTSASHVLIELALWFLIVIVPLTVPLLAIALLFWRWTRRREPVAAE